METIQLQNQETIKHVTIPGYSHISIEVDITNNRLADIRSGNIKPLITSSAKETDKIGGFFPTDQIVIAARTGIGKSAFVLNWLKDFVDVKLNPTYANDLIILFDSWEMPSWRNVLRMYSRQNQLTVQKILDYKQQMQQDAFDRIRLLSQELKNYPIYFRNISQTAKEWYTSKQYVQKLHPNKHIVNVVDHTRLVTKANESREEELISNFMIHGMKLKLEEEQINIFLSQMNRAIETAGKREDIGKYTPVSSDVFGADSVYQCADVLIALHRPGFYGLTEWEKIPTGIDKDNPDKPDHLLVECILKQRDGWTGNLIRRHNLAHNEIIDLNI